MPNYKNQFNLQFGAVLDNSVQQAFSQIDKLTKKLTDGVSRRISSAGFDKLIAAIKVANKLINEGATAEEKAAKAKEAAAARAAAAAEKAAAKEVAQRERAAAAAQKAADRAAAAAEKAAAKEIAAAKKVETQQLAIRERILRQQESMARSAAALNARLQAITGSTGGSGKTSLAIAGISTTAELNNAKAVLNTLSNYNERLGQSYTGRQRLVKMIQEENLLQQRLNGTLNETIRKFRTSAGLQNAQMGDGTAARTKGQVESRASYALSGLAYGVLAASVYKATQSIRDFQQAQKDLQAITQATDADMAQLTQEIQRIAVTTKYSVVEVADAAKVIGQAGFSAVETMQVLGSTMTLAQGTMESTATTASLLTTVIKSFALQATDAAQVADIMAQAVNKSKLDIDKLNTVFNYIGPVAMNAGVSLREMSAAVMVLANNGMKASTIGTSLRNVFSQLASPSKALVQAFNSVADGEVKLARMRDVATPMAERFEILNSVLGKNSDLFKLFGLRAAGTVSILMKTPGAIQEMTNSLYALGTAQEMADKQMEGLGNRLSNLQAAIESTVNKLADKPAGLFSDLIKLITDLVIGFGNLPQPILDAMGALAAFATSIAAVRALGGVFELMIGTTLPSAFAALGRAVISLVSMTGVTNAFTVALAGFNPVALGIIAAAAAIGTLTLAMTKWKKSEADIQKQTNETIKTQREQLTLLQDSIRAFTNLSEGSLEWNQSRVYMAEKMPDLASMLMSDTSKQEIIDALQKRYKEINEANQQQVNLLVQSYQRSFDEAKKKTASTSLAIKQYLASVNLYTLSAADRQEAVTGQIQSQKGQSESISNFKTTLEGMAGNARAQTMDWAKANNISDSTAILVKYSEAWTELTGNLDITKEEFRAVYAAVQQVSLANLAAETRLKNTGTAAKDVAAEFDQLIPASESMSKAIEENLKGIDMGKVYKEMENYSKKVAKITKETLVPEQQDALIEAARKETLENMFSMVKEETDREIAIQQQAANIRIQEIKNEAQQGAISREEASKRIQEIERASGEESKQLYAQRLAAMLTLAGTAMGNLEKIIDPDTPLVKQIELAFGTTGLGSLLQGAQDAILKSGILGGMFQSGQKAEAKANAPARKVSGTGGSSKFGSEERKRIEALKAQIETVAAQEELAYEQGKTSYDQFIQSKIDGQKQLMAARLEEVQSLEAKASNADERATAEKARAAYEKDYANQRLEEIKERREADLKRIEDTRDNQILAYEEESSALKTSLTDGYTAAVRNAELTKATAVAELEALQQQAKSQMNINDRAELERSIREKMLEINEADLAIEQAKLGNIEAQYKFHQMSASEYTRRLNADVSDPYEQRGNTWQYSGNMLDGFKYGMQETVLNTQTMNQTIADGVTSMVDSVSSSLDTLVDNFMEGSLKMKDIVNDLCDSLLSTLMKTALQIMANQIISGIFSGILGGFGGGSTGNAISSSTATGNMTGNWGSLWAKGGAFAGSSLSRYSGSVVSKPTLFSLGKAITPFANGGTVGVMGEAGAEAILPLRRGSDGKLGVTADVAGSTGKSGGVINNINIETPSGYTANESSTPNTQGGEDITVTFSKMVGGEVSRPGSPVYAAMQQTFGARQTLVKR